MKELWRIEHILREGSAQHLTAIALMSQHLAESLAAKSSPEAAYAKKITRLARNSLLQILELADNLYSVTLD